MRLSRLFRMPPAPMLLSLTLLALPVVAQSPEEWRAQSRAVLDAHQALKPIKRRARNVIVFVGDGMGVSTITAARILAGQQAGGPGEDHRLAFETLPYSALIKTYNTDAQVADSAGTATALLTGAKTRIGVVGLDERQPRGQCAGSRAARLTSLLEHAEDRGRATGIVTTTRLTHATPAAGYAHSADRDWESDGDLDDQAAAQGCIDIARQFVEFDHGDGIDFALGGGRRAFLPASAPDPEYADQKGSRTDGRNLIAEWQARTGGQFVWNIAQYRSMKAQDASKVLGLFEPGHMRYEVDRAGDPAGEPSIADMTEQAIGFLSRNRKGYVLLVEGGRIDHAHHAGNARRALNDTIAFDEAVATAMRLTDPKDTLILVTADHSHTLTIAGYPRRGNPILGLVVPPAGPYVPVGAEGEPAPAGDGKPYTTLGYHNGPGAIAGERPRLTPDQVLSPEFRQQALVPLRSETHGGEDVALFARGPWAHLARGTLEQPVVFHLMMHALGWAEK